MTIARPTAASAAATVITKNVMISSATCNAFLLFVHNTVPRMTYTDNVVSRCAYGMFWDQHSGAAWAATTNSTWANIAIIGSNDGNSYPAGTTWVSDVNAGLAKGAGVSRSVIDAATAGVVVSP